MKLRKNSGATKKIKGYLRIFTNLYESLRSFTNYLVSIVTKFVVITMMTNDLNMNILIWYIAIYSVFSSSHSWLRRHLLLVYTKAIYFFHTLNFNVPFHNVPPKSYSSKLLQSIKHSQVTYWIWDQNLMIRYCTLSLLPPPRPRLYSSTP